MTRVAAPQKPPAAAKTAPPPVATTTAPVAPVAAQSATQAPVVHTAESMFNKPESELTDDERKALKKANRKPRKPIAKRIHHPLLKAVEKEVRGKKRMVASEQLAEIPADFNAKIHRPLGRKDFKDESLWYEVQARKLEAKAADLRKQGEDLKALGGIQDRAEAKKLIALQRKMAELTASLQKKGVDTSRLTARIAADLAKKAETNTDANADASAATAPAVQQA